jgi:hypothetical protein
LFFGFFSFLLFCVVLSPHDPTDCWSLILVWF